MNVTWRATNADGDWECAHKHKTCDAALRCARKTYELRKLDHAHARMVQEGES